MNFFLPPLKAFSHTSSRAKRTVISTHSSSAAVPQNSSLSDDMQGSVETVHDLHSPTQMKVAETWNEREAAFRLVQQKYERSGLSEQNSSGMRVCKHHLLDTTDVLVAKRDGDVNFSVTLIRDGQEGLPCESLFRDEITVMRNQGLRLAEVSCVASAELGEDKKQGFETFVRMIALTIQTARRRNVDRLLLAVHPRHAKFYKRMFGCELWTDAREYHAVRGNPAILCSHDFAQLDRDGYRLMNQIYGVRFEPWQMDGTRMSAAEKRFFRTLLKHGNENLLPLAA